MGLIGRLLKPNIAKLESRGRTEDLIAVLESHGDTDLRIEAMGAVVRAVGPVAAENLVTALSDEDPSVRSAAEEAVFALGPAACPFLVEALAEEKSEGAALRNLLSLGRDGIDSLREGCGNSNEVIRRRSLEGLAEAGGTANDEDGEIFFRALLAAVGDRSPEIRVLAAGHLERLGDPRSGKALAAQLKDGDDGVRVACRRALKAIGEPALPWLCDAIADRNRNSRTLGAELLGEVCSGEVAEDSRRVALETLIEHLGDGQSDAGKAVRGALGAIPAEAVVLTKLDRLADPEGSDHEEIREFLSGMSAHVRLPHSVTARVTDALNRDSDVR